MGKHSNKKKHFNARTNRPPIKQRIIDMKPEDLVVHVRRAEKEALPIIKNMELSAGATIILLAQYTQALVTGDPRATLESTNLIISNVMTLWETGLYQPDPAYPFSLEETRFELQSGVQAQKDYSTSFQSFVPVHPLPPRGIGQVAGGIVQHPKTRLWQIWMMLDGPCEFLGAYRDPSIAQRMLEEVINAARQGKGPGFAKALYQKVISHGDDEPRQIPFDMMSYLVDHLQLYLIKL